MSRWWAGGRGRGQSVRNRFLSGWQIDVRGESAAHNGERRREEEEEEEDEGLRGGKESRHRPPESLSYASAANVFIHKQLADKL